MRKILLLNSLTSPAKHDLTMRSEVIDLPDKWEGFYIVLSITTRIGLSIHDNCSTRHSKLTIGMRDIIALEYNFTLLRNSIAEFLEDIDHILPRENSILEGSEFRLIGILSQLIQCEGEEFIFGS